MSTGLPKWTSEVAKAKHIWGYVLSPGEENVWIAILCDVGWSDEPLTTNREPIESGEEVNMLDCFTGFDYLLGEAGWDWLIKEMYFSFDQPIKFTQYQEGVASHTCLHSGPSFPVAPIVRFPVGWARSLLEDIDTESKTYFRIKNLGADPAIGKAWIMGFKKEGAYWWL